MLTAFSLFYRFLLSKRAGSLVKKISWLSIVGISLGVTALIVVMSVMSGLHQSIHNRLLSVEPHLVSYFPGNVTKVAPVKNKDIEFQDIFEEQDVIIKTLDGHFQGAVAKGLTDRSFKRFIEQIMSSQNELVKSLDHRTMIEFTSQDRPAKNEIFIGVDLARMLGVFEGDPLYLITPESLLLPPGELPRYEQVIIKRIIQTSVQNIDERFIYYVRGSALGSFKDPASRKVGYEFWIKNPSAASQVKNDIEKLWPKHITATWQERNSDLFWALRLEKIMIGIFLSIATFIAGFSIISVLSLLISQKESDVVLFEVLGLSSTSTMQLFQKLGWILGAFGVGIGFVIGLSISYYLQFNPLNVLSGHIYYDQQLPSKVELEFVAGVITVAIALIFIGTYWPTRRILQFSPSHILRRKF